VSQIEAATIVLPPDIGALSLQERIDLVEQLGTIGAANLSTDQLRYTLELMASLRREAKPRERSKPAEQPFKLDLNAFLDTPAGESST